jgi:hypothetical protein
MPLDRWYNCSIWTSVPTHTTRTPHTRTPLVHKLDLQLHRRSTHILWFDSCGTNIRGRRWSLLPRTLPRGETPGKFAPTTHAIPVDNTLVAQSFIFYLTLNFYRGAKLLVNSWRGCITAHQKLNRSLKKELNPNLCRMLACVSWCRIMRCTTRWLWLWPQ